MVTFVTEMFLKCCVFAKHPALHSGGVSRVWVHSCGGWRYWQVTVDTLHMNHDPLHVTFSTWHLTLFTFGFLVGVLLSKLIKRFNHSFMHDLIMYTWPILTTIISMLSHSLYLITRKYLTLATILVSFYCFFIVFFLRLICQYGHLKTQ